MIIMSTIHRTLKLQYLREKNCILWISVEISQTIDFVFWRCYHGKMERAKKILEEFGLSDKEIAVYLVLLSMGPSPVRKIADAAGVNRGTTYDALVSLQKQGVVSYYHKAKHQYFVAEDPAALVRLIEKKKSELRDLESGVKEVVPELRSLWSEIEERPAVKYYEGLGGVRTILQDVLDSADTLSKKEYMVYSSASIRPYLHTAYPAFTNARIAYKIFVRVIAIGAGGEMAGYDERRWITKQDSAPTYTLIYRGKLAMISVKRGDMPHGIILEDQAIFETQKILFERTWDMLGRKK